MSIVIDGYNLLYALGKLSRRSGKAALEVARRWLISQLEHYQGSNAEILVVFDGPPPRRAQARGHAEISVLYAHPRTADEVIAEWILSAATPEDLTIVSNDRQIRQVAQKRRCQVLSCTEYVDR